MHQNTVLDMFYAAFPLGVTFFKSLFIYLLQVI